MKNTPSAALAATASRKGRIWFAATATVLLLIWVWILPRMASHPVAEGYNRLLHDHGVDASAMFYTELPCLDQSLSRVRSLHRRQPQALWWPLQREMETVDGGTDFQDAWRVSSGGF